MLKGRIPRQVRRVERKDVVLTTKWVKWPVLCCLTLNAEESKSTGTAILASVATPHSDAHEKRIYSC